MTSLLQRLLTTSRCAQQKLLDRGAGVYIGLLLMAISSSSNAEMNLYFIHSNHLGAPEVMTDQAQQVVWKTHYQPFGETEQEVDAITTGLRFPGQYYDGETGYHYNYYRDYDPSLGRYIQSDPRGILLDFSDPQRKMATQMGLPMSGYAYVNRLNHPYGYGEQNPLIQTDPTGEGPIMAGICEAIAGAGAYGQFALSLRQLTDILSPLDDQLARIDERLESPDCDTDTALDLYEIRRDVVREKLRISEEFAREHGTDEALKSFAKATAVCAAIYYTPTP